MIFFSEGHVLVRYCDIWVMLPFLAHNAHVVLIRCGWFFKRVSQGLVS